MRPHGQTKLGFFPLPIAEAGRRSWRIGQRWPVRVKFMCQEGTMQTACLRHMGKKLLVALTMEGKFADEGLQNIDEDDDMLSAMARELVERNGIGESADAVWKALNAEHQKLLPATHSGLDDIGHEKEIAKESGEGQSTAQVLVFGQPACPFGRRTRQARPVVAEQGSLFPFN